MINKVALVTGASRGIGAETAFALAQNGYTIAVHYNKSKQAALNVKQKIIEAGGRAEIFHAEISDSEDVYSMVESIRENLGEIEVLVCNAGVAWQGLFHEMSDEEWNHLMGVDLNGVFYSVRAVLPGMIHNHSGRIITISSMWGVTGGSCEVAYSAAKGAVIAMTKALAKEVGLSGITVNCIAPGVIDTEMNRNLTQEAIKELEEETPLGRIGKTADIANTVVFLCGEGGAFYTGQVFQPNGGIVI